MKYSHMTGAAKLLSLFFELWRRRKSQGNLSMSFELEKMSFLISPHLAGVMPIK